MKTIIKLSIVLACIAPSIAYSMRLVRSTSAPRVCPQRQAVPAVALAKRCAPLVPRQFSVSMPVRANSPLPEIDKQIKEHRMKKIAAKSRSIAWNATGALVIPPLVVSTVATYYLSAAGLMAAFISVPGWSPEIGWEGTIAVMSAGAVHLASRKALCTEEKLADFIAKKCDNNDKEVMQVKNMIEELRKQRRELSDI